MGGASGPYVLQAAIAACHARARTAKETDWPRIVALYADLAEVAPSPVVELNRAIAVSMAEGPAAGLKVLDEVATHPALKDYHLLPGARGALLAKLGQKRRRGRIRARRGADAQRARTAVAARPGRGRTSGAG